jgi:hypothetical protein
MLFWAYNDVMRDANFWASDKRQEKILKKLGVIGNFKFI